MSVICKGPTFIICPGPHEFSQWTWIIYQQSMLHPCLLHAGTFDACNIMHTPVRFKPALNISYCVCLNQVIIVAGPVKIGHVGTMYYHRLVPQVFLSVMKVMNNIEKFKILLEWAWSRVLSWPDLYRSHSYYWIIYLCTWLVLKTYSHTVKFIETCSNQLRGLP